MGCVIVLADGPQQQILRTPLLPPRKAGEAAADPSLRSGRQRLAGERFPPKQSLNGAPSSCRTRLLIVRNEESYFSLSRTRIWCSS